MTSRCLYTSSGRDHSYSVKEMQPIYTVSRVCDMLIAKAKPTDQAVQSVKSENSRTSPAASRIR